MDNEALACGLDAHIFNHRSDRKRRRRLFVIKKTFCSLEVGLNRDQIGTFKEKGPGLTIISGRGSNRGGQQAGLKSCHTIMFEKQYRYSTTWGQLFKCEMSGPQKGIQP